MKIIKVASFVRQNAQNSPNYTAVLLLQKNKMKHENKRETEKSRENQ